MKKGGHSREFMVWSFTMLTLAISCAAISVLIQQNNELREEVAEYSIAE